MVCLVETARYLKVLLLVILIHNNKSWAALQVDAVRGLGNSCWDGRLTPEVGHGPQGGRSQVRSAGTMAEVHR